MKYLENLYAHEWELTKSPAGAYQWQPKDGAAANTVPDPESGELTRPPTMLTTDLALRMDPVYGEITRRFLANPDEFADAFARAWYKLTHRDMGPIQRYLGPQVPQETLLWQDPVPALDHEVVDADDVASLKAAILEAADNPRDIAMDLVEAQETRRILDRLYAFIGRNRYKWFGQLESCALPPAKWRDRYIVD